MSAPALDAAPATLEPRVPGGGDPPRFTDDNWGRGGGGDHDEGAGARAALYLLGTLLAIASIFALFAALAIVFWIRSRSAFLWEPVEIPSALWISTAILGLSSWMFEAARHALEAGHWFAYRRRLLLTIYFGLGFFLSQAAAVYQLASEGVFMRGNPHASVFYVFTGAHAIHLALGMGALGYLLAQRGRNLERHAALSQSAGIFWHFLGALWVGLFLTLLAI